MTRATRKYDGDTAFASQYEAVRSDYARRLQVSASYVVWKQDGTYYADHCFETGTDYSGANAATVINNVLTNGLTSGRTHQEKVILKGDFTTTIPIEIPDYSHFHLMGKITLANGSNCNIIQNTNQATHNDHVTIEGGILEGNETNQTAGDGINWRNATSTGIPPSPIVIRNMRIENCFQDGININTTGGNGEIYLHHLWIHGNGRNCLRTNDVNDSYFSHLKQFYSDNEAIYFAYGSNNQVSDVYVSGSGIGGGGYAGIHCENIRKWVFTNIRLDNPGSHGMVCSWARFCVFSGFQIRPTAVTAANSDGVRLESTGGTHSTDNIFQGFYIGRGTLAGTQLDYGINETDANQDYNLYSNIDGSDCVTAALRRQGVNSKYDAHTIIGTVVGLSENRGITGAIATGTAVAHGLIGTPTSVLINPTQDQGDFWVDTVGAANFTVNFDAGANGAFYWEAKIV